MGSVVINEFEVLRAAQPQPAGQAPAAGEGGGMPPALEPQDVKDALQQLHMHALRVWAH